MTAQKWKKPQPVQEFPQNGYLPPQALEVEEAVLGAALVERDACIGLVGTIKTEDIFYSEFHKAVFRAIKACYTNGEAIDILTVSQQLLKVAPEMGAIGPLAYKVSQLSNSVHSGANMETHIGILKQKYLRRVLIQGTVTLQRKAYDEAEDEFELVNENQLLLNSAFDAVSIRKERTALDIYLSAFEQMKAACDAKGVSGIPSGIASIDKLTGGWQKSDLIILAARPSMGKTALALDFAKAAAKDYGKRVAFFSLEMNAEQLMVRMISSESGYTNSELTRGLLPGGKSELVNEVATMSHALSKMSMHIDDTAGISIGELRAKALRLSAKGGLDLLIVDYLQLMSGDGKSGNREQEVSTISRGLKKLAKELNIPVIALSQLSRSVETRGGDKRPMLSDLRESGSIEQDADSVIFLFRPEYYGITQDEQGQSTLGIVEAIWAKNRNGATVTKVLKADLKVGRFKDLNAFDNPLNGPPDFARTPLPPSDFENAEPF